MPDRDLQPPEDTVPGRALVSARRSSRALAWLVAGAIGLAALALRAWGAGWSLPYADHPDEPAVINVVLRIVQGQLDPDFFFYPSLMLYLQALNLKLHFWWGLRSGLYSSPLQLPATTDIYTAIPGAFVAGRLLTALLSAASVVVLVTWGARVVGRSAALVAGLLLLASPWAVIHAHYVTVDGPAALFATLALLAAAGILRRGSTRDYLLAGCLSGLAAGTKYQAVLVVIAVALAHVGRWRGETVRQGGRLLLAGAASAAVFLLVSPYVLLNFPGFRRDAQTLAASYNGSHGDVTGTWPVLAYARFLWTEGLRPLPSVLVLVGIGVGARRRPALLAVLLVFPLALLLVSLQPATHFFRNLLPLQPVLLLIAGWGAAGLWDAVRRYVPSRLRTATAAIGLTALVVVPLWAAIGHSRSFALPDSRVVLQETIRERWPGARVASEITHPLRWNGVTQATPFPSLPVHSLHWYREQGYALLLASSGARRAYAWTPPYQPLLAQPPVLTVGGPGSPYRGPRLDLIETGLTPETLAAASTPVALGPLDLLRSDIGRLSEAETGPEVTPTREYRPGDVVSITTFWSVRAAAPPAAYTLFVHLRNAEGVNVVQRDAAPWLGLFPPQSWRPGGLVVERLDVGLAPTLPPGEYRLAIGLYDATTQARIAAVAESVRLPGDEVDLGTVVVGP